MPYKLQHYVFNTYKNKSILIDPKTIEFIYDAFYKIAKTKGFEIVACKILEDHVHCLIKYDSKHKMEYPIKMLKGISAREFFKSYKTNRLVFRKLWARSYFAREIQGKEEQKKAVSYIRGQIDAKGHDKRYNEKEPTISLSG